MKTISLFRIASSGALALLLGAFTTVQAADEARGQLSDSDFKFTSAAASGGLTEVHLGKLAGQKTTTPAVKQFAEQMVTDHALVGAKLKQIATRNGAVLPVGPTDEQQKKINRLSGLHGTEFDKQYVDLMVDEHKENLKAFQKAAKDADNPDLKSFASETAVKIQHHLDMAKELEEQLKGQRASK